MSDRISYLERDEKQMLEAILTSEDILGLTKDQQQVLHSITPVLFEALPSLLKSIDARDRVLSHAETLDQYDQMEMERVEIEPLRYIAQYLFRHNPRYTGKLVSLA
jgi:hypothetical protein